MKHPKDLTGMKFHRLTVLRRAERSQYWICKCDCGKETETRKDRLVTGWTKSCGCLFTEVKTTHGHTIGRRKKTSEKVSRTYESWGASKERCFNPNHPWFHNYGGRGIGMCEEWKNSFETFLKDMGERPPETSLDRIDSNGNYEPGNCKWSTRLEQSQNRRPRKSGYKQKIKAP